MLPFVVPGIEALQIQPGDRVYIPGIRALLAGDGERIDATLIQNGKETPVTLTLPGLTREERDIILTGCLINFYAQDQ
jgi:aconitate hydratase